MGSLSSLSNYSYSAELSRRIGVIFKLSCSSDDIFTKLREKLLERSRDKEMLVRIEAAITLCRLQVCIDCKLILGR